MLDPSRELQMRKLIPQQLRLQKPLLRAKQCFSHENNWALHKMIKNIWKPSPNPRRSPMGECCREGFQHSWAHATLRVRNWIKMLIWNTTAPTSSGHLSMHIFHFSLLQGSYLWFKLFLCTSGLMEEEIIHCLLLSYMAAPRKILISDKLITQRFF